MSVRLGLSHNAQTVWFANDPWFVPERGLRVDYGDDELRFVITLAAKGSPTSLASALRSLRSLVRAIDRGGGLLLIDDGVDVASYPIRDAQLQELPERLELWPSGYARVTLVLRCDAESVLSTATTLLEQHVTQTGEPVVVDPGGPAVLGLGVAPYDKPMPAAIEAYVMDGQYTSDDLVVPLGEPQYDNGTYIYDGDYTPTATEVDMYAEVASPAALPTTAITGAQAVPPYRRLAALIEPPATLVGDWQAGDCFLINAKSVRQPGWMHDGGYMHAVQLSSATTSMLLPPASLVVALRGATLLGVMQRYLRQIDSTWPSNGILTCSLTVTLPSLPSGHRYVVYGITSGTFFVDTITRHIRIYGFPNVQAQGLAETGYMLPWSSGQAVEMTGTSNSVTFSWRVGLDTKIPDDFAAVVKSIYVELAVFAVPDSAFSTIPQGDYRVAIVSYRVTTPVTVVHYDQFVRVLSGYRLRVDFDSRNAALTHKVFIQRVGTTQWYSTSASPPSVTLSAPGTAENLPAVSGGGLRETITVTTRPSGVQYPVQERSTAYVTGGRKLVPVGRLSFHAREHYAVRLTSRQPVRRLWALPRPRAAVAGAYVPASALLESARDQGRQVVRVINSLQAQQVTVENTSYTRPWFMLYTASNSANTQYVVATLEDGSGFVSPAITASPLIVTHPVLNIPLVAVSLSASRVPIAYYHESSNLTSGRTIKAIVYFYNASTTNRTVTVYLEDNRTSGWQETSTTVTVPAQGYTSTSLQLTLNTSVQALAVSLTGSSGIIVYANVVWVQGPWADIPLRQSYYDDDWVVFENARYAGPRLFGWNVTQKNLPAQYPSTSHWARTFSYSFTNSDPINTYYYTVVSNRYLLRQGKTYQWDYSASAPSGYTVYVRLGIPSNFVWNGAPYTPLNDTACGFMMTIEKNTSSGGTVTASWSSLRRAGSDTLATMDTAPHNAIRLGWPQSASSWLIATRIVYRHDVVTGRFMRVTFASGDPLDVEFSNSDILAKRGSTTLLTLVRPSTSPTTLRLSYASGTLSLSVGQPGSWSSVSTSVSLPDIQDSVELDGSQTGGEWGIRWLGLVVNPSAALLAGTPPLLNSNIGAYNVFVNEASYAYWWADEPYYVYRPGNLVLGAQRGVLEVSGKCTLVVFPISSIETRDIVDRAFVLDVLGYEKR